MTEANLAIVFAPNILRPRVETYETVARFTPVTIGVVKLLLTAETQKRKVRVIAEAIAIVLRLVWVCLRWIPAVRVQS